MIKKTDKQSHHPLNFLVEFDDKHSTVVRCLVNAADSLSAIRITAARLSRAGKYTDITRARVVAVYENKIKRIEKTL